MLSLAKLMVSHDLLRSTVTKHITFDQRDSKSVSTFERAMDRCCRVLVSKFETLRSTHHFYLAYKKSLANVSVVLQITVSRRSRYTI